MPVWYDISYRLTYISGIILRFFKQGISWSDRPYELCTDPMVDMCTYDYKK